MYHRIYFKIKIDDMTIVETVVMDWEPRAKDFTEFETHLRKIYRRGGKEIEILEDWYEPVKKDLTEV